MRNRYLTLIAGLIAVGVLPAPAQHKDANKQKLVEMRKTIEGLDWEKVDFTALSPLERCRALMLLNHALDELGSVALAEADLVGAFLEEQNLSDVYAAKPPEGTPLARNFDDARKIASALLQGPMSTSRYATELSGIDAHGLEAYERLYDKTCRGKWEDFTKSSRALRSMVTFLKTNGKLKEYMAWAPTETAHRQGAYEQTVAARGTPPVPLPPAQAPDQPAPVATPAPQAQDRVDSQQAQQALYAAQQPASTPVVVEGDDDWYPGWYNGAIDNLKRDRPLHRDSEYQAQARARVEQRQNNVQRPAQPQPQQTPPSPARPNAGGGRRH